MPCADEVLTHLNLTVNDLARIRFDKHSSCIVNHPHLNLIYFLHKERERNSLKSIISVSSSILFFNVWNVIFPICEKLLS